MSFAQPAEAGRTLFSLPPRRRLNTAFRAALVVVLAADALLLWFELEAKAGRTWPIAGALTLVYVIGFIVNDRLMQRQPRLAAICENGLVVATPDAVDLVDWREVASVTYFETFRGSAYDINAKGAGYRLSERDIRDPKLTDIITLVVHRCRFEWITETIAMHPEELERYRPTRVQPKT